MCSKPQTINGYEVSCRECDQCVATYKNTWVSRCVAEKQSLPYAYAITLTYADVDGEPPLGARVFRYKNVSDMWKRIRAAGKRKWGENIQLRYVVVGEKGTKFGRCHYHGVIFSDRPIIELGKIKGRKSNQFAYKRRLDWSIWGHGFVEFQMADRKGMSYALKYILKSRMTSSRSKGFNREGRTEWLASSYLWCSKVPAVGATWLWQALREHFARGMCPTSLRVRVPGGGDWYVSGTIQKEMCLFLHQANNEFRQKRGRDLAGWSTLLASVSGEIENTETGEIVKRKPWEWLTHGEIEESEIEYTQEEIDAKKREVTEWYEHKKRVAAPITNARATVRNCGNIVPCDACQNSLSTESLSNLEQELYFRREEWQSLNPQGFREGDWAYKERFEQWWQTRLRPSRGCALRDTEILQEKFRRLIAVTKADPNLQGRAAVGKALQKETG